MLRARLEGAVPPDVKSDHLWFKQLDLWLSLEAYGRWRDRQRLDHVGAAQVIEAAVAALLVAKR